mmetsp:Transcript_22144/g.56902  ORF Transcript_22144/g.56902 Transcript_22144/m.56902 type:complete len:88 (-) Transcript_22144:977-1240(-)
MLAWLMAHGKTEDGRAHGSAASQAATAAEGAWDGHTAQSSGRCRVAARPRADPRNSASPRSPCPNSPRASRPYAANVPTSPNMATVR